MNREEIESNISKNAYTYGDVNLEGCHYRETRFIPFKDILMTAGDDSLYGSSNVDARVKDTEEKQIEYYKDQFSNGHMNPKDKLPTVKKMDIPVEVGGHLKIWKLSDGYHKTSAGDIIGMEGYAYDVYEFDSKVRESIFQQFVNCPTQTLSGTQDDVAKCVLNLISQGLVKKTAAAVTQIVEEMWPHKVLAAKQRCVSAILTEAKIPIAFESLSGKMAEAWYSKVKLSPAKGHIDPKTKRRIVTVLEGYEKRRIMEAIIAHEIEGTITSMRLYTQRPGKTQTVRDKRKKMLATIDQTKSALETVGCKVFPFEIEGFLPQQRDGVDRDQFRHLIPVSEII